MRRTMPMKRPFLLAVILLCTSTLPTIKAQVASPGNIQNANQGNGNGNGAATNKNECHTSDYKLPQELIDATAASGFPGPPHIFGLVGGITAGWDPALKLHETPISVRFTWLISALNWNCAAVYSDNWDDALTRMNPLIRTPTTAKKVDASDPDSLFVKKEDVVLYTSDTRFLCLVHGWHAVMQDWLPDAEATLLPVLESFGLYDAAALGYSDDVAECFDGEVANAICLEKIAKDNCYKPAIMGQVVARQLAEYARNDGWNQDGKFNKDGSDCTANCRRFTDFTGYYPVHHPGSTDANVKTRWMPLLEDDNRGYETRQEHVTPHIGLEAKTAAVSRENIDGRVATSPGYNYNAEALTVINRLALTAQSDEKKMKIEFFDNKLDVAGAVIGAVGAFLRLGFEPTLNFILAITAGEYDAIILAWKEKVSHDLVRPTTWIQEMMGNDSITTYAGPFQGVQTIKGKNFESYVRVMPHSEYVSGSACLCQALMELTDEWVTLYGGNPDDLEIPLPLFLAGSSRTEPGVTPAQNLTFVMDNMDDLRIQCGESRLDGGMHFAASVSNSYELCEGIGNAASSYAFALADGAFF